MDFGGIKAASSTLLSKFKSKESLDDVRYELTRTEDKPQSFANILSREINAAAGSIHKLCQQTGQPDGVLKSIIESIKKRCDSGQIQDVNPSKFKLIFEPLMTAVFNFYFSGCSQEKSFKGNENDNVTYFVSPSSDNKNEAIFSYKAYANSGHTEVFRVSYEENHASKDVNALPIVPVISNSQVEKKLEEQVQPTPTQPQLNSEHLVKEHVFKQQLQQQIALQAQEQKLAKEQKKISLSEPVLRPKSTPTPVLSSSTNELQVVRNQVIQNPNVQPTYSQNYQPTSNPNTTTPTILVNKNVEQKDSVLKQPSQPLQPSVKSLQPSSQPMIQGQYVQPVQQKVVQAQPQFQHNVSVPTGYMQPIVNVQPQIVQNVQPVRYVQVPLSQSQPLVYVQPYGQSYGQPYVQQPPHVVQYVQQPLGHQQPPVVQQVVYEQYPVFQQPTGY